jgi:uncharacterized protein (DUF4415 family)
MTRMTKAETAERAAYHHLADTMKSLEAALNKGLTDGGFIPDEWREVGQAAPEPRRTRVTIRLDEDVVKFFRLMGVNYQGRINQVLRAFMLARLAKVVPGPEDVTYQPSRKVRYVLACGEFFKQVTLQNHRMAQGRVCQREELKLRQMLNYLLDEEIAMDLPPEECVLKPEIVKAFHGK